MRSRDVSFALVGAAIFVLVPAVTLPQEEACPPNSHPAGDVCRCDPGYHVAKDSNKCVSDAEVCSAYGAAHPEGRNCVCNEGYAMFGGVQRCVNAAERCSQTNAVFQKGKGCVCRPGEARFGDNPRCVNAAAHCRKFDAVFDPSSGECRCPPGSGMFDDKPRCVSFSVLCARFDAVYNASTDKCECPPGTVENERLEKCLPADEGAGEAPPPEARSQRPGVPARQPEPPTARDQAPRHAAPEAGAPSPRGASGVEPAPAVATEQPTAAWTRPPPSPESSTPAAPVPAAAPARARPSQTATPSPAEPATPPQRTERSRTREAPSGPPPPPPTPPTDLSEPVMSLEDTSLFEEVEVTEEQREVAQGQLVELAASESQEEKARVERQLDTFNDFMPLGESSSITGGEVRLGPVLEHMEEAHKLHGRHEKFQEEMAAYEEEADKVRKAGTLRPGVDPKEYKAAVWGLERIRATLAWAEKEHMHQNVRYFEARYGDESNLKSANFRSLGREHRERFKVPVGKEKQYAQYTDDVVQALASRDCVLNMKGAYEQMLRARDELKRAEARVESMLALPEKPRFSEADRAALDWYRGLGRGY